MIVADAVDIDVMVKQTNNHANKITWYDGKIIEIYYDRSSNPYQIVLEWNGKKKRLQPRFEEGAMVASLKDKSLLNIFVL